MKTSQQKISIQIVYIPIKILSLKRLTLEMTSPTALMVPYRYAISAQMTGLDSQVDMTVLSSQPRMSLQHATPGLAVQSYWHWSYLQ